jgi:prepilin-type N-terminal cleavage/methylation domain-containing protein
VPNFALHAPPPRRPRRAFTLIELVVVIVVMGILIPIGYASYQAISENSRKSGARSAAEQFGRNAAAVAGAESTGVANLSTSALAQVNDDAAKAGMEHRWGGPGADGTVTVQVLKYSYCTTVQFSNHAPKPTYRIGETVKAATCAAP